MSEQKKEDLLICTLDLMKPLGHVPNGGTKVVLCVVTSKNEELEDDNAVIARIQKEPPYVPLDQLYLSPQCGPASTHYDNKLTEEQQWGKLELIVDVRKEVWG